ncbi:hypothetical protein Q0F99_05945 [Rathayibacter oskolensis]|nr:hypothetical protein [Rathayibacter oskolensis]WKK72489.1 hypothetical protein Q0F99_05945 [Rathayibacter oskolensis]
MPVRAETSAEYAFAALRSSAAARSTLRWLDSLSVTREACLSSAFTSAR